MTTLVQALAAAAPLLVVVGLMLGARWSAARAGLVGLAVALASAWLAFGLGTRVLPALGPTAAAGGALLEALFLAATILWIVFPALAIHELQLRTGSVDVLRLAMGRLSGDPRIVALLVAWFFVLFVEGAAGFGTSVALAAPFLVSAGFKRVEAVAIALVGHTVGVSFGAVGTPILPQIAVTPYTGLELSAATAAYHAIVGALIPLAAMLMVVRAFPDVRGRGIWGWTLFAAAAFLVPSTLVATFVGPELPTLVGSLVGGLAFVAALAWMRGRTRAVAGGAPEAPAASATGPRGLLRAAAPYLALIALVLATRLLPGAREALSGLAWAWRWGPFTGEFAPLYHPGTMLALGFVAGALIQGPRRRDVVGALSRAGAQLLPVAVALVAMLGLSRLMVHAGMIEELALLAATTTGAAWPLFAPFVGMLGTFVTGSATASNVLFSDFQLATARTLGLDPLPLLGAQGFGAAVGNIICPHNIVAAAATVQLSGQEGAVLRRTLGVALGYALLGGLLARFVFI
ncbi:MAG: L-lactate permease [Trueperaceae bacterium]